MIYYIIIAVIILIIGTSRALKVKHDLQAFSARMTVAASLAISTLTIPYFLLDHDDPLITFIHIIKYGASAVSLSVYGDIISSLELTNPIRTIYTVFLYSLYVSGPIFASMFIVGFSRNIIEGFKMLGFKTIHVFSRLDSRSLAICESLSADSEKELMLFCNCHGDDEALEKRARRSHALLVERDINGIRMGKRKDYEFYVLSDDEQQCLIDTANLCEDLLKEKYYAKERVIVRSFVSQNSMELIRDLDNKYGKDIYLRYIDENNSLAIDVLLKNKELLANNKHKEIFIYGANDIVNALLSNLLCLLNQPDSSYNIHIFDEDARTLAEKIKHQSPEILNLDLDKYFSLLKDDEANYSIHFYEANEDSNAYQDVVEEIRRPNIVFVCTDDDQRNYETALSVKRYYAYHSDILEYPKIFCLIRGKQLNSLIDDDSIEFFGNYKNCYDYDRIVNPDLEKAAQRAHLSYMGSKDIDDEKKKKQILSDSDFYSYSNQHSSFNVALGLEYHLAYIQSLNEEGEDPDTFVRKWLENDENMAVLARAEHQRWNTYQRLQGYRKMNTRQLEEIVKRSSGKRAKDNELLLHSALVENDDLAERERYVDALYKKYGSDKKCNYVQLDKDFLKNLLYILGHE